MFNLLKKGDFVRIEYEGYNKEGKLFDSTKGEIAKTLHGKEGSILVIIGLGQILKGLEEVIIKMNENETKEILIKSNEAFGEKKKELVKIMKEGEFEKYKVRPAPGLSIHVEFGGQTLIGYIKSVNSGRVMVDFNHPLAGQDLKYNLKLLKVLSKEDDKINELIVESGLDANYKSGVLSVKKDSKIENFDAKKTGLANAIKAFIPEIKKVEVKDA